MQKATYSSGGVDTQVDYLLGRRQLLKEVVDCKVLPNESVARQHRPVVCRLKRGQKRVKRQKGTKKTRWWKLNEQEHRKEFEQKMVTKIQEMENPSWENLSEEMRKIGREILGEASGKTKQRIESWWWNDEVQDAIKKKKDAKKDRDLNRGKDTILAYRAANKEVKKEIATAKIEAYRDLYDSLDSKDGQNMAIRIAKRKHRESTDV